MEPRAGRPRAWPLRTRLTAALVVLLALACVLIGVVSEFALGAFLTRQVDERLAAATLRATAFSDDHGDPLDAPGQASGTLNARVKDGRILDAATLSARGERQGLDADTAGALTALPRDGRPRTQSLGALGDYRLTSIPVPDGAIVTGLPLSGVHDTLLTVGLIFGGVAAAVVFGTGFAGAAAVRRTLRPLDRMAATATVVAGLPLDRGEVALSERVPDADPRTEIGQVGAAFNRMLGHVGDALSARHENELRVRRFVADASHELRTPLAAIRGFAELAGRQPELSPGLAHAIGRIESEADRMTSLVEGLLLLARLDQGRPLELSDVDLSRLATDAVGDARIAGPAHEWVLALPRDPVVVSGDVQRLHQILANLLSNGRTHTPPGTTITTALALSGDEVVLTVTDDGPCIDPAVLPSVFERFARGDSSRSRAAGSTGLGMAIVAAVVVAHHGTVTATSEPGLTRFEVRLPRTAGAQPGHNDGQGRIATLAQ
ncbi:sensor histidine kinase [Amycolatopsis sp. CA-230715]|uniref:sensor histidine kinase n=1 Tax=Amycolatopsis sp. CA-230715 TaxID=2745196 RepID=UPI001C024C9B|nr:HAMP domain-containing sensor histidine kinase [Amycolatopsis sp. CA-230715]